MSLFSRPAKAPDPINPQSMAQSQDQLDSQRRDRAAKGGRGASFLWDAAPIAAAQAKPKLFGGN